jgi:oligopeptide/dipeptide ABC transporter ATP-binding protein
VRLGAAHYMLSALIGEDEAGKNTEPSVGPNIVETAGCDEPFDNLLHPYTQALLSAAPIYDPTIVCTGKSIRLEGDVPSPIDLPDGGVLQSRCPPVRQNCGDEEPELCDLGGRWAGGKLI